MRDGSAPSSEPLSGKHFGGSVVKLDASDAEQDAVGKLAQLLTAAGNAGLRAVTASELYGTRDSFTSDSDEESQLTIANRLRSGGSRGSDRKESDAPMKVFSQ
jgi:hypothetical protein